MIYTNESLLLKWDNLGQHNNSYVRIDASHPLDWHVGFENINQRSLLLLSMYEPTMIASSKSILVSIGQRADNTWAISFKLLLKENEDVFIRLCCDLIESSRNKTNSKNGIDFVIRRYNQWSKLMELQRTGILSEFQRKGLLGEILFLQQIISSGKPLLEAVKGWVGIEGADQDFIYMDKWFEVKSLVTSAREITISSLEQLSVDTEGELVLFFIDKTSEFDPNAFTLKEKISLIRVLLEKNSFALEIFNEKLLSYGYIDLPEYDNLFYRVSSVENYVVSNCFPRLVKENVPTQIVSVNYQISIEAIAQYKIQR